LTEQKKAAFLEVADTIREGGNGMKNVQNFIVKGQEVFIGLEDSKRTWKLCVRSDKQVIHEASMPAQYENLHNYLQNKFPECSISVIYEAGFRGFGLYDKLIADGYHCIVTPPHTVTDVKCQRQKNDRIDSRRLARNLENGDVGVCFVPDRQLREDRQVSRLYSQIQRDITRQCNRIRRAIECHDLDQYFKPGRWYRSDYIKSKEILESLNTTESLKYSLIVAYNELEQLWIIQKDIVRQLHEIAKTKNYEEVVALLKSVPGIGFLTAIRLALEWGDLSRFKRKEDFASFLGLTPSEYSSGEKERKGHITRQGNRTVRAWLIESAWVAIKHDPVLLDKYSRVYRSCGSKKIAIVAVARKLAVKIRAVVLTGEPYQIGLVA
jgi:transposase